MTSPWSASWREILSSRRTIFKHITLLLWSRQCCDHAVVVDNLKMSHRNMHQVLASCWCCFTLDHAGATVHAGTLMLLAEASAALISRSGVFAACAACYLLTRVCRVLLDHARVPRATCSYWCATCYLLCSVYLLMRVCRVLLDHARVPRATWSCALCRVLLDHARCAACYLITRAVPRATWSCACAACYLITRGGCRGFAGNAGERRERRGAPGSAGERRERRRAPGSAGNAGERRGTPGVPGERREFSETLWSRNGRLL